MRHEAQGVHGLDLRTEVAGHKSYASLVPSQVVSHAEMHTCHAIIALDKLSARRYTLNMLKGASNMKRSQKRKAGISPYVRHQKAPYIYSAKYSAWREAVVKDHRDLAAKLGYEHSIANGLFMRHA